MNSTPLEGTKISVPPVEVILETNEVEKLKFWAIASLWFLGSKGVVGDYVPDPHLYFVATRDQETGECLYKEGPHSASNAQEVLALSAKQIRAVGLQDFLYKKRNGWRIDLDSDGPDPGIS